MVQCRGWINVGIVCWVNTCGLFRLFCTGRKCTDLQWIVGAFQRVYKYCYWVGVDSLKDKDSNHSITIIMYTDATSSCICSSHPF